MAAVCDILTISRKCISGERNEKAVNYINPPEEPLKNITHRTFYSDILSHEVGYNIYLPPDYRTSEKRYPVVYHIHGWQGNESSETGPLEKVCGSRQAITVFMNAISSEATYFDALLQIESILTEELIPHIDGQHRTNATRKGRMLSGFSMGGAMAFYYAVKHSQLFGSVTSYAGTYHHQYHRDYRGVGRPLETAIGLYEEMIDEKRYLEEQNILSLIHQNADKIRGNLYIDMHIGSDDILYCDNEIMHLYLQSLNIPHDYKIFTGAGHDLDQIV